MRENQDYTGIDIRSFAEKVSRAVSTRLGDDYEVKLQEVTKNNGVILQGLIILADHRNISPTIYLNTFLSAYESGTSLSEIVQRILEIYREDSPKSDIDMSFFRDFERVKDRICYKLINREKNRILLERIPHIEFMDLCICFYYAFRNDSLGSGSILIHNNHVEMWDCSTGELLKLAQENTPRLYPWQICSMEDVLRELLGEEELELPDDEEELLPMDANMLVLTNAQRVNGAVSMIYPGVLDRVSRKMRHNFYLLPSSIHELILLEDNGSEDRETLRSIVREVNASQVVPEEVLSDNLYYYDRLEERVKLV